MNRTAKLRAQRATMLAYLALRVELGDWHGVRDAAADLEQIDARLAEQKTFVTPRAPTAAHAALAVTRRRSARTERA